MIILALTRRLRRRASLRATRVRRARLFVRARVTRLPCFRVRTSVMALRNRPWVSACSTRWLSRLRLSVLLVVLSIRVRKVRKCRQRCSICLFLSDSCVLLFFPLLISCLIRGPRVRPPSLLTVLYVVPQSSLVSPVVWATEFRLVTRRSRVTCRG